jgi:PAS domain S-box-containing protein
VSEAAIPQDTELRRRAEDVAREGAAQWPEDLKALSPEESLRTLHELRVHQIELEAQNGELRRAQVELDAARERYFDLYDLAPVGYITISDAGLILEANLTAATLLGVARGALVKQRLTEFVFKEDEDIYYLQAKQLRATDTPRTCELRMVKGDGTVFWVDLTASAAQDAAGAPVSRVALSDITARQQAEAEKESLQAQLIEMQKLESVGRLAGGVAHDFNNALQTILLDVELALGRSENPATRPYLLDIKARTARSASLTAQLLAFARRQRTQPRVLDLNGAIADLVPLLQRLVGEDVELRIVPGYNAGPVLIDPSQVQQILTNLADNSRDAITGAGRITIETANVALDAAFCATRPDLAPGSYTRLSVGDDGAGMTPDVKAHVFEPFFTSRPFGERTGLGLAAVYGIVRQNGGAIEVVSEPRHGATFTIWLPRHGDGADSPTDEAHAPPLAVGTETILLVDDEPSIVTLATHVLSGLGYTVLAAERPKAALLLAEGHPGPIHLVIADVVMPEMHGRELVERLAAVRPALKRLLISGHTAAAIAKRGVATDGLQFMSKPFTVAALARRIRQVLDAP